MFEENNENKAPDLVINFKEEFKSEEERQQNFQELLRKRNEILASMGYPIPKDNEIQNEDVDDNYSNIIN